MGILSALRKPKPGTRWDGHVATVDDPDLVPWPGVYATKGGVPVRPLNRLIWIDETPGDPNDSTGHWETAAPGEPTSKPDPNAVQLEAEARGRGDVSWS